MTTEALDYVEKQADKNMEFHLKNIEALNKEAHTTLALLLVTIPASFTCSSKWFQSSGMETWAWAMALTCFYLIGNALYLSQSVNPRDILAPANDARSLISTLESLRNQYTGKEHWSWPKNWDLISIREGELANLQDRIDSNVQREKDTATVVRRSRRMFILTPIAFVGAAVFVSILRSICSPDA